MLTEKRYPTYLLMNGELVPYGEARVHVLTTALKYGATVFEGLRAYWNEEPGAALFMLPLPKKVALIRGDWEGVQALSRKLFLRSSFDTPREAATQDERC